MKRYSGILLLIYALFDANLALSAVDSGPKLIAKPIPSPPAIAARSYLLQDIRSGKIIAAKDIDKRMEPASLTKMMTSYIVFNEVIAGNLELSEMVTVSEKAWKMKGSRMFIEVGKKVSVEDLLKGMIVQSGNDATVALAEHVAGSEDAFVQLMNQYAQQMGMTHTHFANSTGMPDPNHYTTARDLAILSKALILNHPNYYKWYAIKEFTYNNIRQTNRNTLLWQDPSVDGIKTGHTESAGYCLVASA
ncbi:MAG: D-alanyl-D-alanine carboxypeptidase, partial [Gammaproteobacteria bacterium]